MAKRSIVQVASDFDAVVTHFQDRGLVDAVPDPEQLSIARRMHQVTFSLILWRFRLRDIPECGRAFIEEIASDALQCLPQALMGYDKTTKLLIRGIIENTWRHIYFVDHPVEYARMNRDMKWYMTVEDLAAYPLLHPIFTKTETKFDAVGKLRSLYSELSAGVHGRRVDDLEMRLSLQQIRYDRNRFEAHARCLERCGAAANFILAAWHRQQLSHFSAEDRRTILQILPPVARSVWSDID